MRVRAFVFGVLLLIPCAAAAQEWQEYTSLRDGFRLNFPGQPKVTEISWTSQLNYVLPGRVYSAEKGRERYSVTVVDYSSIEQQGVERAKTCPPGNANCRAKAGPVLGDGYAKHDERGAIVYATFKLLQRDAKLNYLTWEWQDLVEGHIVQLTNNADQSRTFAWVGMHAHKLYILEGTVPAGYPEPGLFGQSMIWIDKDGREIRYQMIYSNSYHAMGVYPVPPRVGQGAAAPAAPAAEWTEFVSKEDRFTTNFPGAPRVAESTYRSQFGADLPSRIYSATLGPSRFSVTVVDYRPIEKILTEKAKSCPVGAETCIGANTLGSATGAGYWKADVAGAIVYATRQFMKRDAVLTELVWTSIDLVEGHMLQLTNPDKSRTFASIFMHENRLYLAEATVPPGAPEPGLFQQALGWVDENGKSIRYQTLYHNGFPTPPRVR